MKKLLLMFCASLAFSAVQAQYYIIPNPLAKQNPGGLNVDVENTIGVTGGPAGWTVLHTGPTTAPEWTSAVNLPSGFNFRFNNVPVSDFKVSTSGVLTFNTAAVVVPTSINTALPSSEIPDNSICIWGMTSRVQDRIATKVFGSAPNRQFWVQFNAYSTNITPNNGAVYWSIVLEESTHKIYVVDQRHLNSTAELTVGIQVNNTTAVQLPASPLVAERTGSGTSHTDNAYYEFVPGTQPTYDLQLLSEKSSPELAQVSAPFYFHGKLKSFGSQTVNTFDLNYKVDSNPVVTATVSNANIVPFAEYNYTHPVGWSPAGMGFYMVKIWASNINGNPDQNHANDTLEVYYEVKQSPRKVLNEVFTSSTCGPCLPGNQRIGAAVAANPGKSIDIKYQQDFPTPGDDPYQTTESINRRRNFYAVSSVPHIKPDGGINFASSWPSNSRFNGNSYTSQLLQLYAGVPAEIVIKGTYQINPTDSVVSATATIIPFANITSNNLVLHSVITERRTVNNIRTNGETEFHNVMKKMMPNENGLPIPALVSGQAVTYSNSFAMTRANYTVPYSRIAGRPNRVEHLDSLEVVFFVQDKVTKEVFNAENGLRIGHITGRSKDLATANLNLYPNPTKGEITLRFSPEKAKTARVEVYNLLGEKVWATELKNLSGTEQFLKLDLAGKAAGMYVLNLHLGDNVITRKISVVQ